MKRRLALPWVCNTANSAHEQLCGSSASHRVGNMSYPEPENHGSFYPRGLVGDSGSRSSIRQRPIPRIHQCRGTTRKSTRGLRMSGLMRSKRIQFVCPAIELLPIISSSMLSMS
ncbi:hypothetical protein BST61_g7089 [Cercospora zeina]